MQKFGVDRRNIHDFITKITTTNISTVEEQNSHLSTLTILPAGVFVEIFGCLSVEDIEATCSVSKQVKMICQTQEVTNIIKQRIQKDNYDIGNFTLEELFVYNKIALMKKRLATCIDWPPTTYVLRDGVLFIDDNYEVTRIDNANLNQIIPYGTDESDEDEDGNSPKYLIVLTNDKKIYKLNTQTGKMKKFIKSKDLPSDKIFGISYVWGSGNILITMADGSSYHKKKYHSGKVKKIEGLNNIIQEVDNLFLTREGKVYIGLIQYSLFLKWI